MIPSFISGPIANVFTAFDKSGAFDPEGQKSFLDFLTAKNANSAYFVRSGMGQMYTYSYDDVKAMADLAVSHVAGAVPVIVGTAGIWNHDFDDRPDPAVFTQQAVELSQYAESIGAAGVVHTMPEAIAPADNESIDDVIQRYVETICAAVKCPVILYQPPMTTQPYCLTIDRIQRIAPIPNLVAVKISSPNAEILQDAVWATKGNDFAIIAGNECAYYSALGMGIRGVIGQGCCMNPELIKLELERYLAGDLDAAFEIQRSVTRLVQESENSVEFLKRYINEKGHPIQQYGRTPQGGVAPLKLTDDQYTTYKTLLEQELDRFALASAS